MITLLTFLLFISNSGVASTENCKEVFKLDSAQSIFTKKDNFLIHYSGWFSSLKKIVLNNNQDKVKENLFLKFQEIYKKRGQVKNFKNIEKVFEKSYTKIPEIYEFIQKPNVISKEQEYNNRIIFEAILVTYLKHIPTFLDSHISNKDWARINHILYTIGEFNSKKGNFSLYRIKKSIEGRYSLKEYILCK